jgi:hypothetical protein
MRRLQRHLDLHGKDLILVTRSRGLRVRAREENLPAVGSLRRVNFQTYGRHGWQLGWLTLRLPTFGALFAFLMLLGAMAAGAAVLFWYLPEADVKVFVPTTTEEAVLDITLDGQIAAVNTERLVVPAKRREITVTRSFYRPATGVVQIPTTNAAVGLRFTNRTNAAITVPKGTIVIANNNVRFVTGQDVNLPRLNATGDAIALSQQAGTIGNIPPNTAVRVEGDLAQRVAVTNPAPGEKGTDTPQQVVSEGDIEGVRGFAEPVLIDAAKQELLLRLADSATVFGASATSEITDVAANPPLNSPAKYTEVKVTAKVSVLTADDSDLDQLYVWYFRPRIAQDRMLLDREFTTTVERTGDLDKAFERMPVTVRVQAVTAPYLDKKELQKALAGESKRGAERVIHQRVDSPLPPLVEISPSWAPRLPRKENRISITFVPAKAPAAAQAPP